MTSQQFVFLPAKSVQASLSAKLLNIESHPSHKCGLEPIAGSFEQSLPGSGLAGLAIAGETIRRAPPVPATQTSRETDGDLDRAL